MWNANTNFSSGIPFRLEDIKRNRMYHATFELGTVGGAKRVVGFFSTYLDNSTTVHSFDGCKVLTNTISGFTTMTFGQDDSGNYAVFNGSVFGSNRWYMRISVWSHSDSGAALDGTVLPVNPVLLTAVPTFTNSKTVTVVKEV
jgi:hypothetical protein